MKILTIWFVPHNPHESKEILLFIKKKWSSEKLINLFWYWRVSRILDRVLNQIKEMQFRKNNNLNLKVWWNHYTKGCSLNIMSINYCKSAKRTGLYFKAILFRSDSIYMKGNQGFLVWLKWLRSRTKEYIRDLSDNNKYYDILCKEESFLFYQYG